MVEILEYALVFAVTSVLAGASILVVQGALPILHQTQGHAEFDELDGAAASAALRGNDTIVMPLAGASIACTVGVLDFSTGGLNYSSSLGYPCSFSYSGLTCTCQLVFTRESMGISLEVLS
ncbi:MAG: hypothetical protein OK456_07265 [Thaumarchaeota archaeon]|nr:hypothetical protein [Nitrososphaerota archaeon]